MVPRGPNGVNLASPDATAVAGYGRYYGELEPADLGRPFAVAGKVYFFAGINVSAPKSPICGLAAANREIYRFGRSAAELIKAARG